MALPHIIVLMLYGIAAGFAVLFAWFAIVFTAKYPHGLYDFVEKYGRYNARVNAYMFLVTDRFPPFDGNPENPYEAHWNIGPPLEKYSRWKTFFRGILVIPFYFVSYVLTLVLELASFVAWFVIVFTGKQPRGLQDALIFGMSYVQRLNSYYFLQTEDWPVHFTDDAVNQDLAARGYSVGGASGGADAAAALPPIPPEAPAA